MPGKDHTHTDTDTDTDTPTLNDTPLLIALCVEVHLQKHAQIVS